MNKAPFAIIAGLALTGCMDSKPEIRQNVTHDYKTETFKVETVLWLPPTDEVSGMVVGRVIEADSVEAQDVETVRHQQMEQIQPDCESALEFHEKVKKLQ